MTNRIAQARELLRAIERQQRYSVISPHGSGLGHEVDEDTFICEIAAALLAVEQRVWEKAFTIVDAAQADLLLRPQWKDVTWQWANELLVKAKQQIRAQAQPAQGREGNHDRTKTEPV